MSTEVTTEMMNEVIARFMGITPIPAGTKRLGDIKPPEESIVFLNYHEKWELLMPVVEKIESVEVKHGKLIRTEADVKVFYKACIIEYSPDEESGDYCEDEITIQTQGETKLEAVYTAVYQFITWYQNQQKQTNDERGTNKG